MVNATPRPLYPRERPGTGCIGGWVGPRAGLDRCGKSRSPPLPPPHRDSFPGPFSAKCVAIPTKLSRPKQNLLPDIKFIFNSSASYLMISMLWEMMLVRRVNSIGFFFEQWYWQKLTIQKTTSTLYKTHAKYNCLCFLSNHSTWRWP
jgi:hypothetical protein